MSLLTNTHSEERPWGSFEQFTQNETTTVKIITVLPNKRFSLQTHAKRSEFWKVLSGNGTVHRGEEEREISVGDTVEIPVGTPHRLMGGTNGITILEIGFGEFDENDITRLEDDFGRVTEPPSL